MSLVVTSSNPNDDQIVTGGLNLPYSYTNNLNDPLKLIKMVYFNYHYRIVFSVFILGKS